VSFQILSIAFGFSNHTLWLETPRFDYNTRAGLLTHSKGSR
jgi:hypothetical protein